MLLLALVLALAFGMGVGIPPGSANAFLWIGLDFLIAMTISKLMSRAHPVAPIIAWVCFEASFCAANIAMRGIRGGSIMTLHQSVLSGF